jgi:hypothetical protein
LKQYAQAYAHVASGDACAVKINKELKRDGRKSDHPKDDRADERKRGIGHQNVESADEVHGTAPEFDVTCATAQAYNRSASLKKAGTLIYPRPLRSRPRDNARSRIWLHACERG